MNRRLPGLDLLRALAIGLVMFVHGSMFFIAAHHLPFAWFNTGPVGVDLFFVLSGFLIGGMLLELGERLRSPRIAAGFWLNRALRTLPNYYLFLVLNIAFWQWFLRFHIPVRPWGSVLPSLVFLQSFTHRPGLFFSESWSLCVEEWFYLLFPLGLLAGLGLGAKFSRVYWSAAAIMMGTSVALRLFMAPPGDWNLDVNRVAVHKFDAIAVGLFAVAVSRRWPGQWRRLRTPLLLAGIVILIDCFVYEARNNLEASTFARVLLPLSDALGCSLLLPWGETCAGLGGGRLERAVAAVARWSYSLYLTNFNLSLLVSAFVTGVIGPIGGLLVFVAASLAASAAIYRGFESPILRRRNRIPICAEASVRVIQTDPDRPRAPDAPCASPDVSSPRSSAPSAPGISASFAGALSRKPAVPPALPLAHAPQAGRTTPATPVPDSPPGSAPPGSAPRSP